MALMLTVEPKAMKSKDDNAEPNLLIALMEKDDPTQHESRTLADSESLVKLRTLIVLPQEIMFRIEIPLDNLTPALPLYNETPDPNRV
jgi:hypothetical protein